MNKTQRSQLAFFVNNAHDYASDAYEDLSFRFAEFRHMKLDEFTETDYLTLCIENFLSAANDLMIATNEVLADLRNETDQ